MDKPKVNGAEALHHHGDEPHLLREIIRTYQVLTAGFSREIGIPASRLAMLRILAVTEDGVGVMDLARGLGINAAAVTRQIQELEKDGLIRRRAHPRDGRRTHLTLSPKGRKLFLQIHERSHSLEQSLTTVISDTEMTAAATVLAKLRAFVEERR